MSRPLVFDIETTGLERRSNFICASYGNGEFTQDLREVIEILIHYLNTDGICGHNIVSFDLPYLIYKSVWGSGLLDAIRKNPDKVYDTLHISKREYPTWLRGHDLDNWSFLLKNRYGYDVPQKVEVDDWDNIPLVKERVLGDVKIQEALFDYLWEQRGHKISQTYPFLQSYYPLCIESLAYGLPVGFEELKKVRRKLKLAMMKCKVILRKELGHINYNSPKQIDKALKEIYGDGLPITEKGNPSLNDKNRSRVCNEYPILNEVYHLKDLQAQFSFIDPEGKAKSIHNRLYPSTLFEGDVVIPELNVLATRTLRSQYKNPPLNQFDKRIRELVRAPKGWTMVGIDIIGLENNILGHTLKEMGIGEMDTERCPKEHTLDVFGELFDNVVCYGEETLKDKAKTLNYAILYGQRPKNTCKFLNLPEHRAGAVEIAVEERFPSLSILSSVLGNTLYDEDGQKILKTMYGDKVTSPEYCVVNTWCQTSGMVYAHMLFGVFYQELYKVNIPHYCFAINHDEIQLLFKSNRISQIKKAVDQALESTYNKFLSVTGEELITKLEYQVGHNWKETH